MRSQKSNSQKRKSQRLRKGTLAAYVKTQKIVYESECKDYMKRSTMLQIYRALHGHLDTAKDR